MNDVVRIAMWSGPRNISTAMMRSFENRTDAAVWDEPFYGPYLDTTGKPHPGADEIIATHGSNWEDIVKGVLGPVPGGKPVFYQKHMTHHMLPQTDLSWMNGMTNCFLIRDPAAVLSSYNVRIDEFDAYDIGFPQQQRLFDHVCDTTGEVPVILDSKDILKNPQAMLSALCEKLGISFSDNMLHWPPGPRTSDGVWAKHWYDAVYESTGFAPYREKQIELNADQQHVVDECQPSYDLLSQHRLVV